MSGQPFVRTQKVWLEEGWLNVLGIPHWDPWGCVDCLLLCHFDGLDI